MSVSKEKLLEFIENLLDNFYGEFRFRMVTKNNTIGLVISPEIDQKVKLK